MSSYCERSCGNNKAFYLVWSLFYIAVTCFTNAGSKNTAPGARMFQIDTEKERWDPSTRQGPQELNLTISEDNQAIVEVAAGVLRVAFLCNASYPVSWYIETFENNPIKLHGAFHITRRIAPDPFDYTSFEYGAVILLDRIENEITGRYTCHNTRNKSMSTSVYLYWKGNQDNIFVDFKRNITLTSKEVSNPHKIIFPCIVATPSANVLLYKFTPGGRILLERNDSITYDPKVGFTLIDLKDIVGYYRCFTTDTNWDSDYVGIIVPSRNVSSTNSSSAITGAISKSNPTISIDAKRQTAVCCTGNGMKKPPQMYNMICGHPLSCDYLKRTGNNDHIFHGYQSRQTRKNNCTSFKLAPHYTSGVVRCVGQDFDIQMNYIFPATEALQFYSKHQRSTSKFRINAVWTSWDEIVPEDMMLLDIVPKQGRQYPPLNLGNESRIVYEGQKLDLFCYSSPYYFSVGTKWALKFKNGSVEFRDGEGGNHDVGDGFNVNMNDGHVTMLRIIAHKDLSSIICLAPVWNSSLWVHRAYYPYVNESKGSEVKIISEEKLVWYLNETEKYIKCNATGSPLPAFIWTRNNEILENGTNTEITENISSNYNSTVVQTTLKIHRVSHRSAGVYICEASNYAGVAIGTTEAQVLAQNTWHHTTAIVVGVLSGLGILAAIGFFIWKIKKQNVAIINSSNGIMQGFENGEDSFDDNFHNKTYDPTPMNADLLD